MLFHSEADPYPLLKSAPRNRGQADQSYHWGQRSFSTSQMVVHEYGEAL